MLIYVSVTHLTQPTRRIRIIKDKVEKENTKEFYEAITATSKKGHLPVFSYSMLRGWDDMDSVTLKLLRQTCNNLLAKCDAAYFIKQPIGPESDSEWQFAVSHNLPIYYRIDDIPESLPSKLSPEAFKAYLVEYEQCMQNFRHIYATIWQAGALFAAISAGIIAFASSANFGHTSSGLSPLIQVLVPIPVIFWYLGIFRPMNSYCEQDNDRLVQIEHLLSEAVPGLDMRHFRVFSSSRKDEGIIKRTIKFKWLLMPRVVEVVSIFGFILIIIEIYLVWIYYLSHWL